MVASITRETAREIKRELSGGTNPTDIAKERKLPYSLVWRIASGACWADVPPFGPVQRAKQPPGRSRETPLRIIYQAWRAKRKHVVDWNRISFKLKVPESTLRRGVRDFHTCLKYRCAELQMTSGSYEPMFRKYGIRPEEAGEMDRQSREELMPNRLRNMYNELPALEKELNEDA